MTTAPAAALTAEDVATVYRDLHQHPELSFQEHRTAALAAEQLAAWGYDVSTGIGGTGVVGVLENGPGPTALLRADMDGLPVLEATGLDYASSQRGTDPTGNDVPVMHACGHDVHVACLLGATSALAADRAAWAGRLLVVFQPAEELGAGARAMVTDGLFDRFGRPDVVLGQHVAPFPAGTLGIHPGLAMSASDTLRVTMHGRGGHGSRPEATVDPVVMAAATVLRLQTVVSREIGGTETAVLTVGSLHAGTKENIIPDRAELGLNVRTFDPRVRDRTLAGIERVVQAEAQASGAPHAAEIDHVDHFPALVNDTEAVARTQEAFAARFGAEHVFDTGPLTGSEDVGVLAEAAGAPCAFWFLGGADPELFAGATSTEEMMAAVRELPNNHSPHYAPVITPTLEVGVEALLTAARAWLPA